MGVVWARWVWPEWVGQCGRGSLLTPPLQELAAQQEEAELESGPAPPGPPNDYKDKYRHLIGSDAAKAAARTMEANKAYGCGEQRGARSLGVPCTPGALPREALGTLGSPRAAGGLLGGLAASCVSPCPHSARGQQAGHALHRGGHERDPGQEEAAAGGGRGRGRGGPRGALSAGRGVLGGVDPPGVFNSGGG